ncbi:MAG: hypothetical protein A2452_05150 [Candidatus Firestonebacteria bacterium RIFOXYC2_FULL_39_67]|nr:MAG: hypothetical protein A2497_02540 [Candidatus Firestonebacteria bacterium RifOxyC12_full_39_7]OGF54512.1 MAG: hypothetical protein A2452_05150 [Candidatus Firestonebacteria bacterium RIFOXYC2_FULL_39_67]
MKKLIIVYILILVSLGYSYESADNSGGFLGEYLSSFGSSARMLSLGGASSGLTKDASLSYSNPASIADVVSKQISVFYAPLFTGVSFNCISVGYPIADGSVLGISRVSLDTGTIDRTDSNGNLNGAGTVNEASYIFSYSQQISPFLFLGANLKIAAITIDIYSAIGYGVDVGAIVKPLPFLTCGVTIQNLLVPRITLSREAESFPTNLRLGAAYELLPGQLTLVSDVMFMNVLPDGSKYSDGYKMAIRWFEGAEYKLVDNICVRGGINYKEITTGFGYETKDFGIDYAVGFHSLGISHMVSLTVRFGMLLAESERWIVQKEKEVNFRFYFSRALKMYNEKNYNKAREEIVLAKQIIPDSQEAADLLAQMDNVEKATKARSIIEKAFEDLDTGKETEAKEKLAEAKQLDPSIIAKLEDELLKKADELSNDKKYEESKKTVGRVLFVNPDNTFAQELFEQLQSIMEFVK